MLSHFAPTPGADGREHVCACMCEACVELAALMCEGLILSRAPVVLRRRM